MKQYIIEKSPLSYFFTADTRSAPLWFLVRLYLGWQWLQAGWEKLQDPTWVGSGAGTALNGFIQGALAKTSGAHADVQGWYASFLQSAVLPHVVAWSYFITWGEILVGVALIIGFLVGISAFFGIFMNLNYLLAGTVSTNPIMFVIGLFLVLSWRVAGAWGADAYVLPFLNRTIHSRRREG
jgi:thiosulfate dehydrogenase [quinone] large subunit